MVTAKHFWKMNRTFDFCSAKFNYKPISVLKLDVLEETDIKKITKILICDYHIV